MTEPLRVLHVVTTMGQAGLESFIMNVYRHIDREKVQFDFLLHRPEPGYYGEEILRLGGNIYSVPRANPLSVRYVAELKAFFSKHNYNVVHSHIDCMSALPLSAARQAGIPVRIAHSHSSRQDLDAKYPLKLLCKRRIASQATDLFACGVSAGEWMFGCHDFEVIRNAIATDDYRYRPEERARVRASFGITEGDVVLGHVGRFSKVKNHFFLIELFYHYARLNPNSHLMLVGEGELREACEQKAASLGISSKVKFTGARSDVASLMQAMDVFMMPSIYEGLPLVAVEAQSSGLPCLFSSGVPDDCVILGSSRRLCLSDGFDVWCAAIEECRHRQENREFAVDVIKSSGFDIFGVAKDLEDFYLTSSNRS